ELVHVALRDAGEAAAGERAEDVRVHARARPGLVAPSLEHILRRLPAAVLVGARRGLALLRLAAAPEAGVVERHADRDRELAAVVGSGLRRAPEGARGGVGVLVVL